ncbi:MAG TPA: hypothetical protein PK358_11530 [Spirochaetota bacterium]|nr:hypothetical protein [Spirochaetota bacterium]HPJ35460.1 hypothetical protein [Spirochaetota bacterium]
MKINDSTVFQISVRPGKGITGLFSGIRVGDRISARVLRREGNTALLEFRGRSFTADFLSGLPGGESVDLILSEKTPDRIAFTLPGKHVSDEFVKLLNILSVFSDRGQGEMSIHGLIKYLGEGRIDLFNLNLFLAGVKKEAKEGKSATEMFNSLLAKGVSLGTLTDLSLIFAGRGGELVLAAYYFMLRNSNQGGKRLSEEMAEEIADNILDSVSGDDEFFADILKYFTESDGDSLYGEIPLPDGDRFSRMEYIFKDNSCFFDMEFSSLGKVSANVRSDKSGTYIGIFHENDDIIAFMKGKMEILLENLELTGVKKPVIKFYNSKKMIDKLDVCRTDFYIKREFDVKI